MDTPLKVTLLNFDKSIETHGVLYQPICLTFEVLNQSDNVIDSEVTVDEIDDFYIGGELKSQVPLMPGEKYNFHYNVIPLQIGRLSLPKFNLAEVNQDNGEKSFLIKGYSRKVLILK